MLVVSTSIHGNLVEMIKRKFLTITEAVNWNHARLSSCSFNLHGTLTTYVPTRRGVTEARIVSVSSGCKVNVSCSNETLIGGSCVVGHCSSLIIIRERSQLPLTGQTVEGFVTFLNTINEPREFSPLYQFSSISIKLMLQENARHMAPTKYKAVPQIYKRVN